MCGAENFTKIQMNFDDEPHLDDIAKSNMVNSIYQKCVNLESFILGSFMTPKSAQKIQ